MKIAFYIGLLVLVILGSTVVIGLLPYHFYLHLVNNGFENEYVSVSKLPEHFYRPSQESIEQLADPNSFVEQTYWRSFHFNNFELPLPVGHPLIRTVPILRKVSKKNEIGFKYLNRKNEMIFSFELLLPEKMIIPFENQIFFRIPFIKRRLFTRWDQNLWDLLFTKEIEGKSENYLVRKMYSLRNLSYDDLGRNIFFLSWRQDFFNSREAVFFKIKELGNYVVRDQEDKGIVTETMFFFANDRIYRLKMNYLKNDPVAEKLRSKLYYGTRFKKTHSDAGRSIYSRFRKLTYKEQIDEVGALHLFASFSHNIENEEFMKRMIEILERGRDNIFFLEPLYAYSFLEFGSNFSGQSGKRNEDPNRKLKSMIEKEEQSLIESTSGRDLASDPNSNDPEEESLGDEEDQGAIIRD